MKADELAKRCVDVAKNYKTLYVMGCFGAPLNASNKKRYTSNHEYNKKTSRKNMINAATPDTFGFDCVNLIKGILWGWNGDKTRIYGGADYAVNGVPDIGADGMIRVCKEVSTDFTKLTVGEAVWCPGHIGVYVGNGLAVECTPRWKNCVQITSCNCSKNGYNRRNWSKHGKMPYVEYTTKPENINKPVTPSKPDETAQFKVGEIVKFTGNRHYSSSNATNGAVCKPGRAQVTLVATRGRHPVHLVAERGGDSNVYGWVDTAYIVRESAKISKGDRVMVKRGAKTYSGQGLASFVYKTVYDVIMVQGDRVVIGLKNQITAAMNARDLTKV